MTTTTRTYGTGTVVKTLTIDGVRVDVVRHVRVSQDTLDADPIAIDGRFEALRAGQYDLEPAEITFRENGRWSGAYQSRAVTTRRDPASVQHVRLGVSETMTGAVTAARRNLQTEQALVAYGDAARQVTRTMTKDEWASLSATNPITPGDRVCGWGQGRYRVAIATKVTRTRVHYLFSTPTGDGLAFGSGTFEQVRRLGPGPAATARAVAAFQAELDQAAPAIEQALSETTPPAAEGTPAPVKARNPRRPSAAQLPVLVALADLGGTARRHEITDLVADRGERPPQVAQWVAVDDAGWVTVDRGTPDNRGGVEREYVHTLTPAGWESIGRVALTPETVVVVVDEGASVETGDAELLAAMNQAVRAGRVSGVFLPDQPEPGASVYAADALWWRRGDTDHWCRIDRGGRVLAVWDWAALQAEGVDYVWPAGAIPFNAGMGPRFGFVAGLCGHAVAVSEWRAGLSTCERCPAAKQDPSVITDLLVQAPNVAAATSIAGRASSVALRGVLDLAHFASESSVGPRPGLVRLAVFAARGPVESPQYPEGTPEYAAYAAELRTALAEFVQGG